MLLRMVLFIVAGSIHAAPQYYYSNYYPELPSRFERSSYKKCPSGFTVNAVYECVQPVIERFYYLFESPKVPANQPQIGNQLYGNAIGNNPQGVSPYFFVVQPEVAQVPEFGTNQFASYSTSQRQHSNLLFLQQVNPNLQQNKFTYKSAKQSARLPLPQDFQEDTFSDTSNENELAFDYSKKHQPTSESQPSIQNQESRKDTDDAVIRITSFHPLSVPGHRTGQITMNTNTKTSSLPTAETNTVGETSKEMDISDIAMQPTPALIHMDSVINASPVEVDPTLSTAYDSGALNIFNKLSNSISGATLNEAKANNIHSTEDTFQSAIDDTASEPDAEFFTDTRNANEDVDQVFVADTESREDALDLRINNTESDISPIDLQPASAVTQIDSEIVGTSVEEVQTISTAYKSNAANFFTVPGTKKQPNSIFRASFNKSKAINDQVIVTDTESKEDAIDLRVGNKESDISTIDMQSDSALAHFDSETNYSPVEEAQIIPSAYKSDDQVFVANTESREDVFDLRTENEGRGIDLQSAPVLTSDAGVSKGSHVDEKTAISTAYKKAAVNFFSIPGAKKISNSISGAGLNIHDAVDTSQGANDDTEYEPVAAFIKDTRYSSDDNDKVILEDTESAEDLFDFRSNNEDSSNEDETQYRQNSINPVDNSNSNNVIAEAGNSFPSDDDNDQTTQESIAHKNSENVYFVQREFAGKIPALGASAVSSQGNTNSKNAELLDKGISGKNNIFSLGNLRTRDEGFQLNKMFDGIRANLTNGIINPDSYKGFVYIVADEGKEIVYEF